MILTLYRYQLLEVAHGLTYLHRCNLVHGNLTGVRPNLSAPRLGRLTTPQHNILIGSDGVACISEYGLEVILRDGAPSKSIAANVRWMAPEVLGAIGRRIPSGDMGKATDAYSFAMVMFEVKISTFIRDFETASDPSLQVLSGTDPFPDESDEEIPDIVAAGARPGWPLDPPNFLVDELREQVEACWNQEPNKRPTAFEVLQTLVTLGEARRQEFVISVEDSDDEGTIGDWEYVWDGSGNGPKESTPLISYRGS